MRNGEVLGTNEPRGNQARLMTSLTRRKTTGAQLLSPPHFQSVDDDAAVTMTSQPLDAQPQRESSWLRWWSHPVIRQVRRYPMLVFIPLIFFIAASMGGAITSGPIICIFRLVSGVPCAGCGMTRGFVAIAHGFPLTAMHYNLLSPIAFGWMAGWWLMAVGRLWQGKRPFAHPGRLVKTALVVMVSYWVIRAGWFASQPGGWQDIKDTSIVLKILAWIAS